MKLLIAVDMEGITGVTNWDHVTPSHPEYQRMRRLMTADVNAAIAGALDAGVQDIIVSDGHWDGQNILIEELDPRARINAGNLAPYSMVSGIETGVNAAFFIGYHARAGASPAILDHTWSSVRVANLWLNGRISGETGLNAAVCGHFGAPVLLVSGDQTVADEALEWIPQITTVQVKRATSRHSAQCLAPAVSQPKIREAAAQAVRKFTAGQGPAPLRLSNPVTVTLEFFTSAMTDAASVLPGAKRLDGRKLEVQCADMDEAYRSFRALVRMAAV